MQTSSYISESVGYSNYQMINPDSKVTTGQPVVAVAEAVPNSQDSVSDKEYENTRDLVFFFIRSGELRDHLKQYLEQLLVVLKQNGTERSAIAVDTLVASMKNYSLSSTYEALRDIFSIVRTLGEEVTNESFADDVFEAYQILGEFSDKSELKELKIFCQQNSAELKSEIQRFRILFEPDYFLCQDSRSIQSWLTTQSTSLLLEELVQRIITIVGDVRYASPERRSSVTSESSEDEIYMVDNSMDHLKSLIIPLVKNCLQNIQLSEVAFDDDKHQFSLHNVMVTGEDILPDSFDISFRNHRRTNAFHRSVSKIKLTARNVTFNMSNAEYIYQRKKFPSFSDKGRADLKLAGSGLNFRMIWRVYAKKERPICIELDEVKSYIDKLQVNIVDSNHSVLLKVAKKLFVRRMRKSIEDVITQELQATIKPLGERMNEFFKRVNEPDQDGRRDSLSLTDLLAND